MTQYISIPFKPYPHQAEIVGRSKDKRFGVWVLHRRAGKTVLAINDLIRRAVITTRPDLRLYYSAPTYRQAKTIAWDYLLYYTKSIPSMKYNNADLTASFPNGSRISLLGVENYDALRGIYIDHIVLDEWSICPPTAWTTVIRPALADRMGSAVFCGTPRGRNDFYEKYIFANAKHNTEWYAINKNVEDTRILDPKELEAIRIEISKEEYAQEFLNSFDSSITGSYYGEYMIEVEREGRVSELPYDRSLPVHTVWDIGIHDSTAIIFFQLPKNNTIHIIDYFEDNNKGVDYYIQVLKEKKYLYGKHYAPHDINNKEWGTGKTRLETARNLGIGFKSIMKLNLMDGINATRMLLSKCFFNKERCSKLVEYLKFYRKEYNERLQIYRDVPLHDYTSHAADAMRYLAVCYKGVDDHSAINGQMKRPKHYNTAVMR